MDILFLIIGLIVGGGAAWWIAKFYFQQETGVALNKYQELEKEKSVLEDRLETVRSEKTGLEETLEQKEDELRELDRKLASARSDYANLEKKLGEQKEELEELQEKFTKEFENIAHKILKENTREFEEHSKKNLNELLEPMKEKLKNFQERIEKTDEANKKRNHQLVQQIEDLRKLNNQMHEDAQNLTKALKGDSKAQGDWGELILQSILEKSGLQENRQYFLQESFQDEEGKRKQPDVIVKLPENKNIIVDSKVSLTAYERYCSAEDEEERETALKEHVRSFKSHIKNLYSKDYQGLYDLESLDFVLMFVPVEPAFGLAVQHREELFPHTHPTSPTSPYAHPLRVA
jgi:DNA recombination protein RmuC